MRRTILLLTAMVTATLVACGGVALAQTTTPNSQQPAEGAHVRGEILVGFKSDTSSKEQKKKVHESRGARAKKTIPEINVDVVSVPSGQEKSKVEEYKKDQRVKFAELNGVYHAIKPMKEKETTNTQGSTSPTTNDASANYWAPTDSRYGQQWQFNNTRQTGGRADADIDASDANARAAWDVTRGSETINIAILDSGIDQDHEDLTSKIAKNRNFTDGSLTGTEDGVDDNYGHGTHVAGSAAAVTNNGTTGVAGTCPDCKLYNVKVLGDSGSGAWEWIANGIRWAADNNAKVISMSLGGSSSSSTVQSAVDYAWSKGVVLTAAAGNNGTKSEVYPAAYPKVIAVAATDHKDAKASFSNYGSSWVDVAAPGVSILSTAPNHNNSIWGSGVNYGTISGTSTATPHVAGIAGLIWSKSGLCSTNSCVRSKIETKADRISRTGPRTSNYWYWGRVNAYKSVR